MYTVKYEKVFWSDWFFSHVNEQYVKQLQIIEVIINHVIWQSCSGSI